MKRVDQALVEWGLAPSRSKAQQMIEAGEVEVERLGVWSLVTHASLMIERAEQVRLKTSDVLKYVSRGGLKLEGAISDLKLDVQGMRALDVGQSTGGFTDCLLKHGALQILGVDVGHGQLHSSLTHHPKVISLEGVNARELGTNPRIIEWIREGVDLCVVDLSFISIEIVLPALSAALPANCKLLALIKPQFEVGAGGLNKKGVVQDSALYADVQQRVLLSLAKCGFSLKDYILSRVKGQDGNQEFFAYGIRN